MRNTIQKVKIDMANEVIDAGRFDMQTTMEERKITLESLLQVLPACLMPADTCSSGVWHHLSSADAGMLAAASAAAAADCLRVWAWHGMVQASACMKLACLWAYAESVKSQLCT